MLHGRLSILTAKARVLHFDVAQESQQQLRFPYETSLLIAT